MALWLLNRIGELRRRVINWCNEGSSKASRQAPGLSGRILKLAPFSRKTARAWWDVARDYLRLHFPNPYCYPKLRSLVFASPKNLKSRVSKLSLGDRNVKIVRNIGGKFISLAGMHAEKPGNQDHHVRATAIGSAQVNPESVDQNVEKVKQAMHNTW